MKAIPNRVLSIFPLLVLVLLVNAQVTLRLISLPGNTSPNASFYFAGSIQGWKPGDSNFIFKTGKNGIATLTLPEGKGKVQFKITQGNWGYSEGDSTGKDINNRSFTFTGKPQIIDLTILSWKKPPVSTAASNVKILFDSFPMPQLNRYRRIWLYLPPDYATSTKRYPVIYMHDGQNLFDSKTSFSGEWEVDETLNKLYSEGDYGAIVVGIDNGGEKRIDEYSPWKNTSYGGGEGDEYLSFIVQSLKPYIDTNYRTLTQPEYTCLSGSSMGALISTYGAIKYPGVFGSVGAFSPAYWFSLKDLNQYISTNSNNLNNLRIIHVAGQKESANMTSHLQTINQHLLEKGIAPSNTKTKIDAEGTHSESYWKSEFGNAYKWFFVNAHLQVK
jgi:alpha-glucosidase